MGERTAGVREQARSPREIEQEIDHLRTRLDKSLGELDRRRHELTDVKLQLRRHPGVFIGAGAVVLLGFAGIGFAVWRARRREKLPQKARRIRIAIGRVADRPEKVARGDAPIWEKVVASVATTIAVSVSKKLLDRAWSKAKIGDTLRPRS